MRIYLKTILVSLLLTIGLGIKAQNETIVFDKTVHDFGTVLIKDGTVSCVFIFVNKGSVPIVIQNIKTSCGCTTKEWSNAPVPAGRKGFVKITFDPLSLGKFTKEILVYSNAIPTLKTLQIQGIVTEKILTPAEAYPNAFGDLLLSNRDLSLEHVVQGHIKKDSVEIFNNGEVPFKVTFKDESSKLTVKATPLILPAGGKGFIIAILNTAIGPEEWGIVNIPVSVFTNGEDIGKINVTATIDNDFTHYTPADYAKAAVVSIKKSTYYFGNVTQGIPVSTTFEIKNTGKSDLVIRKVYTENKVLKVKAPSIIKPNAAANVYITLDTKTEAGEKNFVVKLYTNTPYSSLVSFTLTGVIKSSAR